MERELASVMRGNLPSNLDSPFFHLLDGETSNSSVSVLANPILNVLDEARRAFPGWNPHGDRPLNCASMHPGLPFSAFQDAIWS